MYIALKLTDIN